jgi:hypothetical protein
MQHMTQNLKPANRKYTGFSIITGITVLCFLLFYVVSGNLERQLEPVNRAALTEMLLVSLILLGIGRLPLFNTEKRQKLATAIVIVIEMYLHRMLLPVVFSGLWFLFLAIVFLFIFGVIRSRRDLRKLQLPGDPREYRPLLLILPFLLIQLNRMNIAVDYDSLRYGLRSDYVLFNGSFFDALGQINAVYTYPKGLEVLTAPLSSFHSFALLLMFQFWTLLSVLLLVFLILYRMTGRVRNGVAAVIALSMMTSLTNMSITAKTDLITLLLQLIMFWFFLTREPGKAAAAAILSLSMKPTAVVFTTAAWMTLMGMSLWEAYRKAGRKMFAQEPSLPEMQMPESRLSASGSWISALPALIFSILFTGIITLRTLVITGVPYSTTFTALFQALGFRVKWPFNFDAHVDYGASVSLGQAMLSLLRRLFLFLFCPVGDDMVHVMIAWGGVMVPVLLYAVLGKRKKLFRGSREQRMAAVLLMVLTGLSLLTFYFLWQVDGNYYIFWDVMLVITAMSLLEQEPDPYPGRIRILEAGMLWAAAFATTIITSWAGAVGFTPVDFVNKGYYDNLAEIAEAQRLRGSYGVWSHMAADPATRVIAFAETPECYEIPCNVESIADVEGSGGSPGLYDKPMFFEWFLTWADTDYLYIERGFLEQPEETRAREMVETLIREGMISDIMTERASQKPELHGIGPEEDCYLLLSVDKARLRYIWEKMTPPPADPVRTAELLGIFRTAAYFAR